MINKTTKVSLRSGHDLPLIGLGTYKLTDIQARESCLKALNLGYRHIDTACRYGNQKGVGKAIHGSSIPRENIFITSKLWRDSLSPELAVQEFHQTLAELGVEYLDLYLIHWPDSRAPMKEVLELFVEWQKEDKLKSIGVSNFTIDHLEKVREWGIKIDVNQVEFHPSLNQADLWKYCYNHNIHITAYSPLAQGTDINLELIQNLASKYHKSPAQIIINWLIGKEISAIPRSTNPQHLRENLQSHNFSMDTADLHKIDRLDKNNRIILPSYHEFNV